MKKSIVIFCSLISVLALGSFTSESHAIWWFFKKKETKQVAPPPPVLFDQQAPSQPIDPNTYYFSQKQISDKLYGSASTRQELRFALISDVNLYPIPMAVENIPDTPKSKIGILYDESQVILQETIRDIVKDQKKNKLDYVLFGGNQVANNLFWNLFLDIIVDLNKIFVPFDFVYGDGEYRGPEDIDLISRERYWSKSIKGVNFVVIDNHNERISQRQLDWLFFTMDRLSKLQNDIFVFSYRPLKHKLRKLIETAPNLRLLVNSYNHKPKVKKPVWADETLDYIDGQASMKNYYYLSNTALSVYPSAYAIITRKSNGEIKIEHKAISLPGIRKKAKDELRRLGFEIKQYELR